MDSGSETQPSHTPQPSITLPETLTRGTTILLVGPFDPSRYAIGLRLLAEYGTSNDAALIVTTLESADETIGTWNGLSEGKDHSSIAIVDTTSEKQSIAATYETVPTFYTPSSGDLERIVMALSELSGASNQAWESRHLVVRSLTPILREAPTERVCRVLERINGLRTGSGLGLYGIDASMHDQETMTALAETVDAVVWIEPASGEEFDVTYHSTQGHVPF